MATFILVSLSFLVTLHPTFQQGNEYPAQKGLDPNMLPPGEIPDMNPFVQAMNMPPIPNPGMNPIHLPANTRSRNTFHPAVPEYAHYPPYYPSPGIASLSNFQQDLQQSPPNNPGYPPNPYPPPPPATNPPPLYPNYHPNQPPIPPLDVVGPKVQDGPYVAPGQVIPAGFSYGIIGPVVDPYRPTPKKKYKQGYGNFTTIRPRRTRRPRRPRRPRRRQLRRYRNRLG